MNNMWMEICLIFVVGILKHKSCYLQHIITHYHICPTHMFIISQCLPSTTTPSTTTLNFHSLLNNLWTKKERQKRKKQHSAIDTDTKWNKTKTSHFLSPFLVFFSFERSRFLQALTEPHHLEVCFHTIKLCCKVSVIVSLVISVSFASFLLLCACVIS